MDDKSEAQFESNVASPQQEVVRLFSAANHVNRIDPQLCINLISILDSYLTEEVEADKPFLVKDGMKIIL